MRFSRTKWLSLAVVAGLVADAAAQSRDPREPGVLQVRGPVYLLDAGGANITASIGPDGVFLVDTGPEPLADEVRAAVRNVQERLVAVRSAPPVGGAETRSATQALFVPPPPLVSDDIRYIVNTSALPEHVGGNPELAIVPVEMSFQDPSEIATNVYAHENVLLRLSGIEGDAGSLPFEHWPSNTYLADYRFPHFNGEGIHAIHVADAVTSGDTLVWFRGTDVISTGDIYRTDGYPVPRPDRGGSIQGVIEGLNRLVEMALVEYRAEGGTLFVPGHGRISDRADVVAYRDMVTIIRDRIQSMIDVGMGLEQIIDARPHRDYDLRYAPEPGAASRFTEAVFESLVGPVETEDD